MTLVMGVDSSTQATKVEVRRARTGELVASGRAPHPPTTPPVSEQDPESWWQALRAAMAGAGSPEVDAVSVAAQQHGMVALGPDRKPLRPAKLWNDTTSAAEAEELRSLLGGPSGWAEACGSVPVASFTITKVAWLAHHEPEHFARLVNLLLPHDWLTFRLTGRMATDRGDASGTGYWSPAAGEWRPDLLSLVDDGRDWSATLPQVLEPSEAAGRWEGAIVGPGTGDNMAAALALGLRAGDVAVSIGTSGTIYAVSDRPTADATGSVAGFADGTGRFLPLVCTLNATKVTDAFARLLGVDHAAFDELVLAAQPGAGGLTLVPYLDGERTPDRPDATGTLAGIQSDVGRPQIARAAVEGVVCGLLDGLDALGAAGVPTGGRMLLVGGGARSAAYRQLLADLAQRPVDVPALEEHVAAGASVQAAAVLDGAPPDDVAASWGLGSGTTVDPSPGSEDPALEVRARYAIQRQA